MMSSVQIPIKILLIDVISQLLYGDSTIVAQMVDAGTTALDPNTQQLVPVPYSAMDIEILMETMQLARTLLTNALSMYVDPLRKSSITQIDIQNDPFQVYLMLGYT